MKKNIAIILVLTMALSIAGCGKKDAPAATETPPAVQTPAVTETPADAVPDAQEPTGDRTMGQTLKDEFNDLTAGGHTDAQEIADSLLANPVIGFSGAVMEVEPGYLAGFSAEINGFDKGVMFGPVIGSIPFVGYIFVTESEDGAAALVETLLDNADPRWNICVEADETVTATAGNLVFFVMCPNHQ